MNLPAANLGRFANHVPPPPILEQFILLPGGSCIPATPAKLRIVLRQVRTELTKAKRIAAREKVVELQCALDDRKAARALLQELADIDRERRRNAVTLQVRVKPEQTSRQTTDIVKRVSAPRGTPIAMTPVPSSWVVDSLGMRGVYYAQSYLGRSSPGFHRGATRERWDYEARDEAVLRDAEGEPVIFTNLGDDVVEVGAAWQAIEDATIRKNGKIQIRIIVALDADASEDENRAALDHFCKTVLDPLGLPYSAVIHRAPDGGDARNVHAHILTNFRPTARVAPYSWAFADHVRGELDGRDGVQMLRHLWAHSMSEAAEGSGRDMLYTGLGHGARGLRLESGEHLGEALSGVVARGGHVAAHERNLIKGKRNALRRQIADADKKIAALVALRDTILADGARSVPPVMSKLELATLAEQHPARLELSRAADTHVVPVVPSGEVELPVQPMLKVEGSSRSPQHSMLVLSHPASVPAPRIAVPSLSRLPDPEPLVLAASASASASASALAFHPPLVVSPHLASAPHPHLVSTLADSRSDRVTARTPAMLAALAAWRTREQSTAGFQRNRRAEKPVASDSPATQVGSLEPIVQTPVPEPKNFLPTHRRKLRARRWAGFIGAGPGREESPRIPTRDWLEDHPQARFDAQAAADLARDERLLARLRRADAYIGAFEGTCLLDPRTTAKLGVGDDWFDQPHVQRGLAALRAEQQRVVAGLAAQAKARPFAFDRVGLRFWPNNLDPVLKARLDRWSRDEMFGADVTSIERAVRRTHRARDVENASVPNKPSSAVVAKATFHRTKVNPTNTGRSLQRLRALPFERGTDRPTPMLLALIRHVGEHPHTILMAEGRMSVADDAITPVTIRSLIARWHRDAKVCDLVARTAALSEAAGHPVWPPELRAAIADGVNRQSQRRGPAQESGPRR